MAGTVSHFFEYELVITDDPAPECPAAALAHFADDYSSRSRTTSKRRDFMIHDAGEKSSARPSHGSARFLDEPISQSSIGGQVIQFGVVVSVERTL